MSHLKPNPEKQIPNVYNGRLYVSLICLFVFALSRILNTVLVLVIYGDFPTPIYLQNKTKGFKIFLVFVVVKFIK